ncbi:MAG: TonB-dependent receptor [Hyphomonadaceae bacterium]|nr:TonB-dependent receptor [Hyphomonadaceae bacterium]
MTNDLLKKKLFATSLLASAVGGLWAGAAVAQETGDEEVPVVIEEVDEDDEARQDKVVVTGSRLRRDSFSSVAPLQVITAETAVEAGLIDSSEILKSGTSVNGVQLDTNVNSSFVTNGGPGASNVSLRGLGADRTLVLVNGRRFAPAGVEGAPSLPDINLIPTLMISRVETLLDGASSIYGSDAIAGVQNVILRDEFDGVAFQTFNREPLDDGGKTERYGMIIGSTTDEGKFVLAAEYRAQEALQFRDRDFQMSDDGRFCSMDIETNSATGEQFNNCGGAIGSVEFRSFTSPFGQGAPFVAPFNSVTNSRDPAFRSVLLEADDEFIPEQTVFNVYGLGDRDINVFGHDTNVYSEVSYSNSQTFVRAGFHGQLFPSVAATNPTNPLGFTAVPVIFSPIGRSNIDVDVTQTRFTAGARGSLDFLGSDFLSQWEYDVYGQYSRSVGDSIRPAVLEERLALSLSTTVQNPDGSLSCGNALTDLFGFITQQTCVPINLFAPSLYNSANPQFATQAELDYISGERSVTTKVDQMLFGGFVTGPLFKLPGGEAGGVLGFEYREDGLDSGTDTIAATGGAAGFFADRRSQGQVSITEAYGEIELPLLANVPGAEELTVNLSGRYVSHEFFDDEFVYSGKVAYSPVEYLTLRGTYGTAYRAPGLRELFLGGQSGFASGFVDPCVVPNGAQLDDDGNPATPPVYDPTADTRTTTVLANCTAEGVDPTSLGLNGVPGVETFRAGNTGLSPETSEAWTAGFVFEQPFTDAIDVTIGVTYFDITVEEAPVIPSTQLILQNCYQSQNFPNDPFCQRRVRDAFGNLSEVNVTPFNLSGFGATGYDLNLRTNIDFQAFGSDWEFITDTVATYSDSVERQILETSPVEDFVGDAGQPEWAANVNARLITGDWTLSYGLEYIGEVDADRDSETLALNGTAADGRFETTGARTSADTIVSAIDAYYLHNMSVQYEGDTWSATLGVRNVFDEDPPLVDQDAFNPTLIGNVPVGSGYDILGRSLFLSLTKEF